MHRAWFIEVVKLLTELGAREEVPNRFNSPKSLSSHHLSKITLDRYGQLV